mmetsp:Transcript_2129/g.6448  ORF Transcript_2129/g.6448 Transcript_2129/m.6448 type:complete len:547 (+) Transcript_2129:2594-4234(+)
MRRAVVRRDDQRGPPRGDPRADLRLCFHGGGLLFLPPQENRKVAAPEEGHPGHAGGAPAVSGIGHRHALRRETRGPDDLAERRGRGRPRGRRTAGRGVGRQVVLVGVAPADPRAPRDQAAVLGPVRRGGLREIRRRGTARRRPGVSLRELSRGPPNDDADEHAVGLREKNHERGAVAIALGAARAGAARGRRRRRRLFGVGRGRDRAGRTAAGRRLGLRPRGPRRERLGEERPGPGLEPAPGLVSNGFDGNAVGGPARGIAKNVGRRRRARHALLLGRRERPVDGGVLSHSFGLAGVPPRGGRVFTHAGPPQVQSPLRPARPEHWAVAVVLREKVLDGRARGRPVTSRAQVRAELALARLPGRRRAQDSTAGLQPVVLRGKRHALREGRLLRARRVVFHLSALLRARRHGRPVHLRGEGGRRPVQPRRARRADAGHPPRTEWHPRRRHGFQEDDSSMSTHQKSSKRASSLQVRSRPAGDDARNLLFDSTVDDVYDPSIFVTYHDAQAYPEYLIKFSQSGQAGGHPKAGTKSHGRYRPNVLAGTEFE